MREEIVVNGVRYVLAELADNYQAEAEALQERLDAANAELTASEAHLEAVMADLDRANDKIEDQRETVFELMHTNGAIGYLWRPSGLMVPNYGGKRYAMPIGRISAVVQLRCGCVAEINTDELPYPEALDVMVAEARALQEEALGC